MSVKAIMVMLVTMLGLSVTAACGASNPGPSKAASGPRLLSEAAANQLALTCLPNAIEAQDGVVIEAGETFLGGPGRVGPWLQASGDFAFSAEINPSLMDQAADLGAFGTLPQGEFWRGTKVAYFGLRPGALKVTVYTGESAQPSLVRTFTTAASARWVRLGIERVGSSLAFRADDREVGRIADPGLFPAGEVYLGANVAPHVRLGIRNLRIDGHGLGIKLMGGLGPVPSSADSLRANAKGGAVAIGAFAEAGPFLKDQKHRTALGREFGLLSMPVFPVFTHPVQSGFDFCLTDSVVAFAEANQMAIRGDTLVYHHGLPKWLTESGWSRDQISGWVKQFVTTVVGRYRGKVQIWEVTDEIFNFQDGNLQDQFWLRALGEHYVEDAFRWAHAADPKAVLIYNDNSAEGLNPKSDAIYGLLKDLRLKGVPVHGVGLQAHFALPAAHHRWSEPPSQASIAANLKRLHDLGLSTHITEMDVLVGRTPGPAELEAQAQLFRETLATCQATAGCASFTTWGVSDIHSWIRSQQGQPWEKPLLFDDDFQPKPAHRSVAAQLRSAGTGVHRN